MEQYCNAILSRTKVMSLRVHVYGQELTQDKDLAISDIKLVAIEDGNG